MTGVTTTYKRETSTYASDAEALLIGIDLGTSRSGVAAANGQHKIVESYVGWPKDAVSLRYMKKTIVFGKEAVENRLSLKLYRPLEKGVLKCSLEDEVYNEAAEGKIGNKEAARELIRYLTNVTEPERDQKVYGVVGVPAQASIKSKKALIEAAKGSMDAVMLVSQPFAVAYGLGLLDGSIVIDIGAGTIDICRMHGAMPDGDDQISLDIAGDRIDEKFAELLRKSHPEAQFTVNMLKKIKERYAFVTGEVERVKASLPCNGRPTEFDVTDELKAACEIIIDPICEALQKLIGSFDRNSRTG